VAAKALVSAELRLEGGSRLLATQRAGSTDLGIVDRRGRSRRTGGLVSMTRGSVMAGQMPALCTARR
jgi:hypothetical protein